MRAIANRRHHYGPQNPFPGSTMLDPERLVTVDELAVTSGALANYTVVEKVAELACARATGGPIESVDLHKERMSLMSGNGSPGLADRLILQKAQEIYRDFYSLYLIASNMLVRSGEVWDLGAPRLADVSGLVEEAQRQITSTVQGTAN